MPGNWWNPRPGSDCPFGFRPLMKPVSVCRRYRLHRGPPELLHLPVLLRGMITDGALASGQLRDGRGTDLADVVACGAAFDPAHEHAEEPTRPFLYLEDEVAVLLSSLFTGGFTGSSPNSRSSLEKFRACTPSEAAKALNRWAMAG